MSTLDTKFVHDNSNANNALLRSKLVLGNIGWRLSSTIHGHGSAQHADYIQQTLSSSSRARGQCCRSGFRQLPLSPVMSMWWLRVTTGQWSLLQNNNPRPKIWKTLINILHCRPSTSSALVTSGSQARGPGSGEQHSQHWNNVLCATKLI